MPAASSRASDTKRHAAVLADWLEARIAIDQPINIHLTGCHHSCAQHYVADIGLLATKVEPDDDDGGRLRPAGRRRRRARSRSWAGWCARKWCSTTLPPMVLALLQAWQRDRAAPDETFQAFTARLSDEALAALCEPRHGDRMMNAMSPPIPLIPENAPFSPAQRAWLNGFLAGLYGGAGPPACRSAGAAAVAGAIGRSAGRLPLARSRPGAGRADDSWPRAGRWRSG